LLWSGFPGTAPQAVMPVSPAMPATVTIPSFNTSRRDGRGVT
jgi:hypothetical protein